MGGGLYTPKSTSTTYTVLLLRSFGLPARNPAALVGAGLSLNRGCSEDGGINFYPRAHSHSEAGITGMVLSVAAYFQLDDPRIDELVDHLLARQIRDGGWSPCGGTKPSGLQRDPR